MTGAPGGTGAVTWRDIYRAVAESEVRIVAAINTAVAPLAASSNDHEQRIRALEVHGSPRLQEFEREREANVVAMRTVQAGLEARIHVLEADNDVLKARASGILSTLSAGQKTILLLAAVAGIASLAADFIARILGA